MLTVSGSIYIATNGSEEEDMKAFLDIGIFNSFATSNRTSNLSSSYVKHEKEKKRTYEQRVREIQHTLFTPIVLSATEYMAYTTPLIFQHQLI